MRAALRDQKIAAAVTRTGGIRRRLHSIRLVSMERIPCWPGTTAAHARRHCWGRR